MGKYDYQGNPPVFTREAISQYLRTRLITLVPDPVPQTVRLSNGKVYTKWQILLNPFITLQLMSRRNWVYFTLAFLTWSWDAFDYFCVSQTTTNIAASLNRSVTDITWGMTLVLMFRTVGSIIFGIPGDRYGRKWPFVINCVVFVAAQIGTGFVQTYHQFLAIRALLGIAMGGIYGNVAATALEDIPPECRGIISGLFQLGYAFGNLLCTVFNEALTYHTSHGWRSLFWFGAGPTALLVVFRLALPETETFKLQRQLDREHTEVSYRQRAKDAMKHYWLTFVWLVVLCAVMNFMAHASQDLYPTFLKVQLGFSDNAAVVTNCVSNFGSIAGAFVVGHACEFLGRRLSLLLCCVIGGAITYPWVFVRNEGINAAAFFFQFIVQGAWATMPIYLSELSPPEFRALIVGTAYQMGNLASSASSTIESKLGEQFPLRNAQHEIIPHKFDYGKVMAIFLGAIYVVVIIVVILGPERRQVSFISEEDLPNEDIKYAEKEEAEYYEESIEGNV